LGYTNFKHSVMKHYCKVLVLSLVACWTMNAQVGVGNTNPKATLDISASNSATPSNTDGVLIPRVAAFPLISPEADQNGMLIFLTSDNKFYYWNWDASANGGLGAGTWNSLKNNWVDNGPDLSPIIGATKDVTIGGIDDVTSRLTVRTNKNISGLFVNSGTQNSFMYGIKTQLSNNSFVGTSSTVGSYNDVTNIGNGLTYGNYNTLSGDGSGTYYATYNLISGAASGDKYGSFNKIGSSAGGQHYGVYSETLKPGAFAGYFLGAVSIGTTGANNYRMPAARGGSGQIMQTDASGNVTWVPSSSIGGWSLSGNTGTNPSTQFLGTIDSVNIAVRTNNIEKWRFTTLGQLEFNNNNNNTNDNILIGKNAGNTAAASAGGHTFVGNGTGQNVTALSSRNTYIGLQAGENTSSGSINTFVGTFAGKANTTGSANTFLGKDAGVHHTTGGGNIAIGQKSALGLDTGNFNIYIGQLLSASDEGNNNIVIGNRANLGSGSSSNNNVILGFEGGGGVSGANNILLGGNSLRFPDLVASNQLTIGNLIYGVNVDGTSNTVSTGNIGIGIQTPLDKLDVGGKLRVSTSITNAAQFRNDDNFSHQNDNNIDFGDEIDAWMISSRESTNENSGIYGDRDFVTVWAPADSGRIIRFLDEDAWGDNDGDPYNNGAELAYIDNVGQFVQASDKNRKEQISKINNAIEKISKINGYTYQYKVSALEKQKGETPMKTSGVLAQELYEVLPEAVQISENGEYFVHYAGIIPLLIEGMKQQQLEIQKLKKLEERISKLENRL